MNDETSSASAALASWGQRAALTVLSALLLATPLAEAQPAAAVSMAPPARANTALSGTVLRELPAADLAACQTECNRTQGCTGWNFVDSITPAPRSTLLGEPGKRQPAKCTLLTGKLGDAPATGVASCVMPCTSAPGKGAPPVAGVTAVTPGLLEVAPIKSNAGTPAPKQPPMLVGGGMVIGAVVPPAGQAPPPQAAPLQGLLVGTGVSDITGPAAEVGMMGYGEGSQITAGIQTRLWARAFIFANPTSGKRIVFVSAELGQLFSSVKQGVVAELRARFGNIYDDQNVQIAATHTHGGPGGYAHHFMYNVTTKGFIRQNYEAIVNGIVSAVAQAHGRAAAGGARIAEGDLADASIQRSPSAFALNLDRGTDGVNRRMTVLRIEQGTSARGAINWFSVHPTSVSNANRLITSDNKGHAALTLEKLNGTILPFQQPGAFVAAFPNGDEGDASPNTDPGFKGPGGRSEFDSAAYVGEKQAARAAQLLAAAREDLGSEVYFRHTFVDMPTLAIRNTAFTNGAGGKTLCTAAYGVSFAAGAKDGPTGMFREGITTGSIDAELLRAARQGVMPLLSLVATPGMILAPILLATSDPCQAPKPVLIPSGALGATPSVLPFQILRVGSLAILGVPGEMSATAGRRLTTRVRGILAPRGITRVIVTGLANEYSGYITTPEEYDAQQYEGASTLFGRLTFEAYLQIFGDLATAMASGQPSPAGATPQFLPGQISLQTGVVLDTPMPGETMGQVLSDAPPVAASNGERWVSVRFRSGHPKNDLRLNDTYVLVEKNVGGAWVKAAWDAMPEVRYAWTRDGGFTSSHSYVDAQWLPPLHTAGTFRIRHFGAALDGSIRQYVGTSREFEVRDEAAVCVGLRQEELQSAQRVGVLGLDLGRLGAQQANCQAGTTEADSSGRGGGRKPKDCVDADDIAAKAAIQAQLGQANLNLASIRTRKSTAGCVY